MVHSVKVARANSPCQSHMYPLSRPVLSVTITQGYPWNHSQSGTQRGLGNAEPGGCPNHTLGCQAIPPAASVHGAESLGPICAGVPAAKWAKAPSLLPLLPDPCTPCNPVQPKKDSTPQPPRAEDSGARGSFSLPSTSKWASTPSGTSRYPTPSPPTVGPNQS